MTSSQSLRHQLAQELRSLIRSGKLAPGDKLPSEPELAHERAVSRSSMRAAITMLEEEGFVSRRHGSGTYVTHRPALPNDLSRNFGVSSLIASTGLEPGTAEETCELVLAPPFVAEALEVPEGAEVTSLRRVRTADGRRFVDTTDWCRADHLSPEKLSGMGDGSVYAALAARGLVVHHGVATITPGNADAETALRLGVARGALLLTIDQVDMTAEGVPVLVSREHHLADAFSFTVVRHGPGVGPEVDR
ncbi:MAG TPA: GntR family transcriptional regulator [Solirubrobacteraceae bacterium]|nr:GntR family transcriptional regulator [Solirubrobacteraceae bacterium]